MAQQITPLALPAEWPDIDCPRKRVREKVPVIGALVCWLFASRWLTLDKMVQNALKARGVTIEEAWVDYPELLGIARDLQLILDEQLWGFKPIFVPEDPYSLLGQLYTGDLCEVEAIMTIEEHFGVELPKDGSLVDAKMVELAEFIAGRHRQTTLHTDGNSAALHSPPELPICLHGSRSASC